MRNRQNALATDMTVGKSFGRNIRRQHSENSTLLRTVKDMKSFVDQLPEESKQAMLQVRANCMPEVDALLAAGWRFELPEIVNRNDGEFHSDTEPWQWYWRRPPRRKGSRGMKFWSTTMAFNALNREVNI